MARRQRDEQEAPGIVVLYTSLMILLLAFFIMLNSISKVEEAKVEAAYQSLMSTFGFQPGGLSPFMGADEKVSTFSAPINPVEQDYLSLRGLVKAEGFSGQIKLLRSDALRSVVLPDALLFEPGSTRLTDQARSFLDKVAGIIKDRGYPITLRGHTDDAPPMETGDKSNWYLSAQRALVVLRYLALKGVDQKRMAAFGLAGSVPLVPNSSLTNRRLNNRVEMVFDANDPSLQLLPESPREHTLEYKGFLFDLFKRGEK